MVRTAAPSVARVRSMIVRLRLVTNVDSAPLFSTVRLVENDVPCTRIFIALFYCPVEAVDFSLRVDRMVNIPPRSQNSRCGRVPDNTDKLAVGD